LLKLKTLRAAAAPITRADRRNVRIRCRHDNT